MHDLPTVSTLHIHVVVVVVFSGLARLSAPSRRRCGGALALDFGFWLRLCLFPRRCKRGGEREPITIAIVGWGQQGTYTASSPSSSQPPSSPRHASQTPDLPRPAVDVPRESVTAVSNAPPPTRNNNNKGSTHRLKLVQLRIRFVRRLVRPRFRQNLCKVFKHGLLVQLVAVVLEPLDQLLHGALRLEWEEREAEADIPPLTGVVGESETLAELLDDVFSLFFLRGGWVGREVSEKGRCLLFRQM